MYLINYDGWGQYSELLSELEEGGTTLNETQIGEFDDCFRVGHAFLDACRSMNLRPSALRAAAPQERTAPTFKEGTCS